jgi:hypothetical protein
VPGHADLGRINALPVLKTGGCAQIVGRHGDLLATAREARLAADARDADQGPAPDQARPRRWWFGWRLRFRSVAGLGGARARSTGPFDRRNLILALVFRRGG